MNYRTLGTTGWSVSEIGYGAWGIGKGMWVGAEDDESLRSLHAATDRGVTFFDTALVYGDGHSETLVGKFLKQRSERLYTATKVPPKNGRWPARAGSALRDVFPFDHIIECAEKSLKNMAVETIDLLQFHVWLDDWAELDEWKEAVAKLKKEGKIRHLGISINDHQPANALKAAATGLIDAFQVIYNIFDQSPEDELLPYCLDHNIGIIARVPLDEGALTGTMTADTKFPEGDFRAYYFRGDRPKQVVAHVEPLKKLLGPEAATLPELALRYCLQHPAVTTIIPGMRTVRHVEANCALSDGRKLSPALVAELKKHRWDKNFYGG